MKTFLSVAAIVGLSLGLSAFLPIETPKPAPAPQEIQWLSISEAHARNQKAPRKFLIDVYTDWCGWCKVMDKNTFRDARVAAYVNQHYYAVKLDAEQREPIKLGDQKFEFVPQGQKGYHQLAASLLNGQMSYPTTVFLDEQLKMIQPLPGYMDANVFHQVITFIGDGHYKKQQFEKYKAETYPKLYTLQKQLANKAR